jgi:hypothetical protein
LETRKDVVITLRYILGKLVMKIRVGWNNLRLVCIDGFDIRGSRSATTVLVSLAGQDTRKPLCRMQVERLSKAQSLATRYHEDKQALLTIRNLRFSRQWRFILCLLVCDVL